MHHNLGIQPCYSYKLTNHASCFRVGMLRPLLARREPRLHRVMRRKLEAAKVERGARERREERRARREKRRNKL